MFVFIFRFVSATSNLDFDLRSSIILLEQLYKNWNNVIAHLRLADRAKAFKYHMKDVISDLLVHFLPFLFLLNRLFFQPKSLDETFYKAKTYPAKLFLKSYFIVSSLLFHFVLSRFPNGIFWL